MGGLLTLEVASSACPKMPHPGTSAMTNPVPEGAGEVTPAPAGAQLDVQHFRAFISKVL